MSNKKKKREDDTLIDGESFKIERGHFFIGCCDCGLVHHYLFDELVEEKSDGSYVTKPIDKTLIARIFRDDMATEGLRKK